MGVIDDYLNSLEGQENLDPLEVASKMFELHKEELGPVQAKIEELNGTIAEKDTSIADALSELTKQKAKNFDLAMQVPGARVPAPNTEERDPSNITIDDLFKKGNE